MIPRDVIELFILFILAVIQSQYVYGFPGRRDSANTYTMDVVGAPGYIYVRIWRGQEITLDKALNMGGVPNPNVLVRMERRNGRLVVVDADPGHALSALGENVAMANVPKHRHFIGSGLEDPVEGRRILPGLISPAAIGGLNVKIEPFHHPGGYFPGDADFPVAVPGSNFAAVGVYVDISTNAAGYLVGTTHTSAADIDDNDLFVDLAAHPVGIIPCGAVILASTDTGITVDHTFLDWRFHPGGDTPLNGIAPADATYIVQMANSGLSAEQALGALGTGLLKNTTTTGVLSIAVEGTDYFNGWVKVKNTSGATANAQDVGYINGSNEYKTTTTANDPNMTMGGCVVLVGAANNSDIYVARRGRVTLKLNGNCSIGDYLFSSTTAGQADPDTVMRPELFAIAQTANSAGAGGTCEALLYTNTVFVPATDTNNILRVATHSTSIFTATINGAPSATSVVYTPVSGSEDILNNTSSSEIGKQILWNTTRSTGRLIQSTNTGTNTITTTSTTDAWANGDTLTIQSQVVANNAIDVDMSEYASYPPLARAMELFVIMSDTAAGFNTTLHPYDTFATSKRIDLTSQVNGVLISIVATVPLFQKRFAWISSANGAGTQLSVFRLRGFFVATS